MEVKLDFEHRLTEVEGRSKSNTHRLDKLEESTEAINKLAVSMERMSMKQDTINANVNKLTTKVEALEAEPGNRWKFVVEKAIYLIVAAVVGFVLARVGL